LTPQSERAVVLGGTDDHIRLIELLKARGYHTTLIDYLDNPPARAAADEHIQESAYDEAAVSAVARRTGASLVITACIDQALLTACRVAEDLGLPAPFSAQTAELVTNKVLMKRRMVAANIPTSAFTVIDGASALGGVELQYPLIVKPADSHGSFGVRKVESAEELRAYAEHALGVSRSGRAIVEEYTLGMEVNVDAYLTPDQPVLIMHGNVRKARIAPSVNLIFQTIIPAPISEIASSKIEDLVRRIGLSFGLANTPLLVQTIVKGDDVSVIEFGARVGGASKHKTVKHVTGFDILDALVDSFVGVVPSVAHTPPTGFFSRNHIYTRPGRFGRVENVSELLRDGVIVDFNCFKTHGMEVGEHFASKDRVGSFLVSAGSVAELQQRIRQAVSTLEVLDVDGRPMMRKDVFSADVV
jgi:biotin carboxylase